MRLKCPVKLCLWYMMYMSRTATEITKITPKTMPMMYPMLLSVRGRGGEEEEEENFSQVSFFPH